MELGLTLSPLQSQRFRTCKPRSRTKAAPFRGKNIAYGHLNTYVLLLAALVWKESLPHLLLPRVSTQTNRSFWDRCQQSDKLLSRGETLHLLPARGTSLEAEKHRALSFSRRNASCTHVLQEPLMREPAQTTSPPRLVIIL